MKSSPLKRGKPLARNTRLKRVPFVKASSWLPTRKVLERRSRLKPVSDRKQAQASAERAVRAAVLARDGGCLLRGRPDLLGPCRGRLTFGHLWKAGQGGPYTEANGIALCVFHNDECENEPDRARAVGLVVAKGVDHAEAEWRRQANGLVP